MKKHLGKTMIVVIGLPALLLAWPVILAPWNICHGKRVLQPMVEELQTQYPGMKISYGASYEGGKGLIQVSGEVAPDLQSEIKESVARLKAKHQITLRIHLEFDDSQHEL